MNAAFLILNYRTEKGLNYLSSVSVVVVVALIGVLEGVYFLSPEELRSIPFLEGS
jgi:hypothetical protein